MTNFQVERSIINGIGEPLSPVKKDDILKLKGEFEKIPSDFLLFLENVGSGNIGNGKMQIYDGLVYPEEIYDPDTAEELGNILFFGDDYQGYGVGFSIDESWSVVEFDPSFGELTTLNPNFTDFIIQRLDKLKK